VRARKLRRPFGAVVTPPKLVIWPDDSTSTIAAVLSLSPFVLCISLFSLVSLISLPTPSLLYVG
jgi:hypothetical protein